MPFQWNQLGLRHRRNLLPAGWNQAFIVFTYSDQYFTDNRRAVAAGIEALRMALMQTHALKCRLPLRQA